MLSVHVDEMKANGHGRILYYSIVDCIIFDAVLNS